MNTEQQKRIDAYIASHEQGEEDCRRQLGYMARGGISRLRTDALQPGDKAFVEAKGYSDRRENPNDYAMERLAVMTVQDSAELQAAGWRPTIDVGETRLFATMLKHTVARMVPTLYVPNKVRATFPVDNSIPAGAHTVAFDRIIDRDDDDLGQLSPKADDILEVDLEAEEDIYRLATFARAVTYSLDELESAAFAAVQIRTERLAALNRAAERVFELVSLLGYGPSGIVGLYNDANVTVHAVVTGAWAAATHDQIVGDCRALIEGVYTGNSSNVRPNRLVVPSNRWTYMGTRRANTDLNVLSALMQDYPALQIVEATPRADLYNAGGAGPRMMAFTYDPDMIKVAEPRRFTLEAPEKRGFNYRIPGRQKLGGAMTTVPLSVGYMDGI